MEFGCRERSKARGDTSATRTTDAVTKNCVSVEASTSSAQHRVTVLCAGHVRLGLHPIRRRAGVRSPPAMFTFLDCFIPATCGGSDVAQSREAAAAQPAPHRSRSRIRSPILDKAARLFCRGAAHCPRQGRLLASCDKTRFADQTGARRTARPQRQRRYDNPTISASASTCSAYRPTGLSRMWFAPAATSASRRSRKCSGVP